MEEIGLASLHVHDSQDTTDPLEHIGGAYAAGRITSQPLVQYLHRFGQVGCLQQFSIRGGILDHDASILSSGTRNGTAKRRKMPLWRLARRFKPSSPPKSGSPGPRSFPMDLIVRTPAEVRRRIRMGDRFVREVTSKGIALHESRGARMDR